MKLLYLSGPISGRPWKETTDHFTKIKKKLCRSTVDSFLDIHVIDPTTLCPKETDWHKAMKSCIATLIKCDGIALLKGWEKSRGAKIELSLAQELNIPVVFIENNKFDYLSELFTAAPESLRYFNARLTQFHNEGVEQSLAENRAEAELVNRYLDPYGFEYIEISGEE